MCHAAAVLLLALCATASEPHMLPRAWRQPIALNSVVVLAGQTTAAKRLVDGLERAGATVERIEPDAALDGTGLQWRQAVRRRTAVVLGGIHTNRAMLPLYARYLSFGDFGYPGADGFVIRTIGQPLGPGTAAVALEASTDAGEEAAVERFLALLANSKTRQFPATLEAHLSPQRLREAQARGWTGQRYVLTGEAKAAAEAARRLIAAMDPKTGWLKYGDYGIERYAWAYSHLQDAPGIDPNDVQQLDQALLATAVHAATQWWRQKSGQRIGGRHQVMGTSCFTAVVHLLRRRGAPNPQAAALLDTWWAECQAYWQNAATAFHDDTEGITSYYCPEATLDWALIMGFDGYLGKQLPLVVRRAYAVVDNLGTYAGTGTYEECRPGDVFTVVPWGWTLKAAAFFHPGLGYDWLYEHVPNVDTDTWGTARSFAGARGFAVPESSQPPHYLLGVVPVPVGLHRYQEHVHDRKTAVAERRHYLTGSLEQSFEKLCFRHSFEPDGQYFVLEGFQTPLADNSPPMDANSIIRYTDLGHVWLHANSEKPSNLFRSAVFCTDGMNDSPQPAGCELQAMHSGPRVGLAASHMPDYVACDWTRNVIWRRDAYFVVIDLLRQIRKGRFGLVCSFRTPQSAWLVADGMVAREGDAEMHIRSADAVHLAVEGGHELEGAAIPTLLRQTQRLDGTVGTIKVFRNLVYATNPQRPAELEIRPVGSAGALVAGSLGGKHELALVAAGPKGRGIRIGPFETDGQVLYVGSGGVAQAGGSVIKLAGKPLPPGHNDVVMAALEDLWRRARPAQRRTVEPRPHASGKRLWRFDGFSKQPPTVRAPAITCSPPAEGLLGSLVDGVVTRWPTVRWPAGRPVTLTVDLRQTVFLAQIDFQTGRFGPINAIPDPSTYPDPRPVTAAFSNDGFREDVRRRDLTFTSDCTFENLHKGQVYPILRWTCRDLAERARHVRLIFDADHWNRGVGMNELSVRSTGPNAARIIGSVVRDDGVVAWTDQAELAVVRSDGSSIMRKRLPGWITSADYFRELGPPEGRLLVATREARLYCLTPDGQEVWRTDFLESQKLNSALPTGYSFGLLRRRGTEPVIVVGNYNMATFVSASGKVLRYLRLPGAYQTMTLPYGFEDDGKEQTVSTEVWGTLSVLDAGHGKRASVRCPLGKGVLLDYWSPSSTTHAIVCTENGLGRIDLKQLKWDWLSQVRPINDCVVTDLQADGKREVLLAKHDGYLLVYDDAGALTHSVLLGTPVRAVAAVPLNAGGHTVVAALPGRLLDLGKDLTGRDVVAVGEYHRLAAPGRPGVLLAFGNGAVIDAFTLEPRQSSTR